MKPFVRKIALLASLALVSGGLLVSTSASAGAQTGYYVQSKFNGRCMTAATGQNGAGVIMVDCQNAPTQRWYWDAGRLRNADGGRCLTAAWGNGDNGAHLQIYDCVANVAHQIFYRPASHDYEIGRIRSWLSGNRCVDISAGNWWNGAAVQLYDCHGGLNQKWWA
ncbi:RICIN domain-containing protein [Lentzea alba]|uniref:RICIN domain-containing protein n=1 Tax=Lentzea alba TaxID=2714351 RepID=UPI0039BF32A3